MFQITNKSTGNEPLTTWAKRQDTPSDANGVGSTGGASRASRDNKNLLSTKKLKKRSKTNSSRTDFLTLEVKKAFTYLQKAYIKALILRYFDLEYHIQIKNDILGYAISGVLSQLTSKTGLVGQITYKFNDQLNLLFEISQ